MSGARKKFIARPGNPTPGLLNSAASALRPAPYSPPLAAGSISTSAS